MDERWLWLTVVVFVPNALGIIIYLIVRVNGEKRMKCHQCGGVV